MKFLLMICLIFGWGMIASVTAQTDEEYVVITPQNASSLTQIYEIGTNGFIYKPQLSPTGDTFAMSGEKGVWLYDAQTFERIHLFEEKDDFAYSPDGQSISLSESDDNTIEIWNIATLTRLNQSQIETRVNFLDYNHNGLYQLYASYDYFGVKFANTRQPIDKIDNRDWIIDIQFSPVNDEIAVVGYNQPAEIWTFDGNQLELAYSLDELEKVVSFAYSPDGSKLVLGTYDGILAIWDFATGDLITTQAHNMPIYSVDYSPDGQSVLSAPDDMTIQIWNTALEQQTTLSVGDTTQASFMTDDSILVLAEISQQIQVWDIPTQTITHRLDDYFLGSVLSLAYSPDGRYLVVGGYLGVQVRDAQTTELLRVFFVREASGLSFGANGRYLAINSSGEAANHYDNRADAGLYIWDLESDVPPQKTESSYSVATLHPTLPHAIIYNYETESIEAVNIETDELITTIENGWGNFVFSPSGNRLAIQHQRTVSVWSTEDYTKITDITDIIGIILDMDFSPTGRYLAGTDVYENFFYVWDATEGYMITGGGDASEIDFSPSGQLIATLSPEYAISLYDVSIANHLLDIVTIPINEQAFRARVYLMFSPDGKFITISHLNGSIRIWGVRGS